ncbi:M48 family metallopeptidase [Arenimonas sp. GDDSR-1]|uniref:M48 family metallopeptidase n=1 Tax=Arenimonas sp. GDDSR-1 TaxID=2950125 RepID=UPI00261F5BDF|nr:M48 family metallopeptidase [Arenimonas sp. GDDSR-1]
MRRLFTVFLALCLFSGTLAAQAPAAAPGERELPAGLIVPDAAKPGPGFDADKATQSYIDLLTPEQRAQSDAYFEGGYWLQLWGFLYGLMICAVFIVSGLSVKMRDIAKRISHRPWLYTAIFGALWLLASSVLSLPWALYTEFYREHAYGLSNLTLGGWFEESGKNLLLELIIMPWLVAGIFAAVRKAGESWWLRAGIASFLVLLLLIMVSPVFINPLFNDYKPLPDGPVKSAILSLARANQIPTDNVKYFDASKQTTRVSANVSGFAGTTQVSLNDNLLNKTSLPEVKAVMGHEMGHYVLNHAVRNLAYISLVLMFGFWFVHKLIDRAIVRVGTRYGITERTDPAVLPIAVAVFSFYMLLATPVINTIIRTAEKEADLYGLNSAREPHGFATAAMRLSTYRKIHPGYWEEVIFYDHPSGYDRVHSSMLWLQENQELATGQP